MLELIFMHFLKKSQLLPIKKKIINIIFYESRSSLNNYNTLSRSSLPKEVWPLLIHRTSI